jgi:hypothetical protein
LLDPAKSHSSYISKQQTLRSITLAMAQPKSRLPLILGVTAAGGVGYYLYTAGGNPKVAEKQFESKLLPILKLHMYEV